MQRLHVFVLHGPVYPDNLAVSEIVSTKRVLVFSRQSHVFYFAD